MKFNIALKIRSGISTLPKRNKKKKYTLMFIAGLFVIAPKLVTTKMPVLCLVTQLCLTLCNPMDCS